MKPATLLLSLTLSSTYLVIVQGQVFSTALAATYIAGAIALKVAAKYGFALGAGLGARGNRGGGGSSDYSSSSSYSSGGGDSYSSGGGDSYSSGGSSGGSSGYGGRKRRVAVEADAIMLEASQEDAFDCAKKLVCLIHAKPAGHLSPEEKSIHSLFGNQIESIDVSKDTVEFELAALMGRKVGASQCNKIYSRCPHEQTTLLDAIKQSYYHNLS